MLHSDRSQFYKMGSGERMDFHGVGNAEIAVAALSEEVFDPFRNADDCA